MLSLDKALYPLSFFTLSLGRDAQTHLGLSVKQHRGGNESTKRKLEEEKKLYHLSALLKKVTDYQLSKIALPRNEEKMYSFTRQQVLSA